VNGGNLQALKRAPRKDNKFELLKRVKFGRSKKAFKVLLSDFYEYHKELDYEWRTEWRLPVRQDANCRDQQKASKILHYVSTYLCMPLNALNAEYEVLWVWEDAPIRIMDTEHNYLPYSRAASIPTDCSFVRNARYLKVSKHKAQFPERVLKPLNPTMMN
jgi:hypothetical protein